MRHSRRFGTGKKRGATLVEFSLTILIILFVFFLLFEFSMWIYTYNVMSDAAKAGVRYAIVHGSGTASGSQAGSSTCASSPCASDCTTNIQPVVDEVTNWASFSTYPKNGIVINVCYLDGSNVAPNRVQVQITAPITPYFSMFSTPAVKASAQGRIVN